MALSSIKSELKELKKNPSESFTICEVAKDMFHWEVTIMGPTESPFVGGVFHLSIDFPRDYPYVPPKATFMTKIFHPNINSNGRISPDVIKEQWNAACTVSKVIPSIPALLSEPNWDAPLVPGIAQIYNTDRDAYEITARLWTREFAKDKEVVWTRILQDMYAALH